MVMVVYGFPRHHLSGYEGYTRRIPMNRIDWSNLVNFAIFFVSTKEILTYLYREAEAGV